MTRLPTHVTINGTRWQVRRAWPGSPMPFEASSTSEPGVRAGTWSNGQTGLAPRGTDRHLPALGRETANGTVVSHRLHRRAVIRTDDEAFVKVVRPGRAAGVLAGVKRARWFADDFSMPRILAADDDSVRFAAVPGRTPHDLAAAVDDAEWNRIWRTWSERWIAAMRANPGPDTPVHDAAAETEVVFTWVRHAAGLGISGLDDAAQDIAQRLATTPDPLVGAHRDLHDKQLLWDGHDLGLLDVDTAARCEAALDLGNLRAHARLRERQGVYSAGQAAVVRDAVDATADAVGTSPHRLAAYEEATLLRLGCLYAFRPRWVAVAADLRDAITAESPAHS